MVSKRPPTEMEVRNARRVVRCLAACLFWATMIGMTALWSPWPRWAMALTELASAALVFWFALRAGQQIGHREAVDLMGEWLSDGKLSFKGDRP